MACTMFFGNPPPNMRQWILDHETPSVPESDEPIGQSEDGTVKVYSIVDSDESAAMLTAGHQWTVTGEGLAPNGVATDGWTLDVVKVQGDGIDEDLMVVEGSDDKTRVILGCDGDIAAPGDYEVTLRFQLVKLGSMVEEVFTIIKMIRVPQGE